MTETPKLPARVGELERLADGILEIEFKEAMAKLAVGQFADGPPFDWISIEEAQKIWAKPPSQS